jgi:MGT family glycosyltransferase
MSDMPHAIDPPSVVPRDEGRRHLRVLGASFVPPGHLLPPLGIASELVARGHHVDYWVPPEAQAIVRRAGLQATHGGRWSGGPGRGDAVADSGSPVERIVAGLAASYVDRLDDQLAEFAAVLDASKPDVVVAGATVLGLLLAAEARDIPCVAVTPTLYYPVGGDIPPPLLGIREHELADVRSLARARDAWQRAERPVLECVAGTRERLGLPARDGGLFAQLTSRELTLVPSSPLFDFARADVPENVVYVGPCAGGVASALQGEEVDPAAWDIARPAVLVTAGTASKIDLVGQGVEAARSLGLTCVALSWAHPPEQLHHPPAVYASRFIPMDPVLDVTDVMITNGGSGGVIAALSKGRPLVVSPQQSDQVDNAARAEASRTGVMSTANASDLAQALSRVLDEPAFTRRACEIAADLADRGGAAAAASAIEQLVRERR